MNQKNPPRYIQVDPPLCILCGMCQVSCPETVIEVQKKEQQWTIRHKGCTRCGICVKICPRDALALTEERDPGSAFAIPQPRPTKRHARKKGGGAGMPRE